MSFHIEGQSKFQNLIIKKEGGAAVWSPHPLMAVECPKDMIYQIGGWLTQGVGASYELGHNHRTLTRWLLSIVEAPNLET